MSEEIPQRLDIRIGPSAARLADRLRLQIYVNGKPQTMVVAYDIPGGWIERISANEYGHFRRNERGDDLATERVEGRVIVTSPFAEKPVQEPEIPRDLDAYDRNLIYAMKRTIKILGFDSFETKTLAIILCQHRGLNPVEVTVPATESNPAQERWQLVALQIRDSP